MIYKNFEKYLNNLKKDIYPQPFDRGHYDAAVASIGWFLEEYPNKKGNILDIGCGEGFCQGIFKTFLPSFYWYGVCLGKDFAVGKENGLNVFNNDMHFLPFKDESFDLGFARHTLEHSPMPLIALMEWKRVIKDNGYLFLVLPHPDYWNLGGRNHYSVLYPEQWWWLFTRAGFWPIREYTLTTSHSVFMKHYMPEVVDRKDLVYPGRPKKVEYWVLLESGDERID
jgi:SAM-dependent methyltransferase